MRGFDSAKDTYQKFDTMMKDLNIVKETKPKTNGFFSKPEIKKENNMAQYAELQKALLLTNQIREQREMINNATSTA